MVDHNFVSAEWFFFLFGLSNVDYYRVSLSVDVVGLVESELEGKSGVSYDNATLAIDDHVLGVYVFMVLFLFVVLENDEDFVLDSDGFNFGRWRKVFETCQPLDTLIPKFFPVPNKGIKSSDLINAFGQYWAI